MIIALFQLYFTHFQFVLIISHLFGIFSQWLKSAPLISEFSVESGFSWVSCPIVILAGSLFSFFAGVQIEIITMSWNILFLRLMILKNIVLFYIYIFNVVSFLHLVFIISKYQTLFFFCYSDNGSERFCCVGSRGLFIFVKFPLDIFTSILVCYVSFHLGSHLAAMIQWTVTWNSDHTCITLDRSQLLGARVGRDSFSSIKRISLTAWTLKYLLDGLGSWQWMDYVIYFCLGIWGLQKHPPYDSHLDNF